MKEFNVRQYDGSIVVVKGKEVEVCGVRCFQHNGGIPGVRIVSEYSSGLRVGSGNTYKEVN